MAVGDDATAAGFPLVAGTEQANTLDTEINISRDLLARKIRVSSTAPTTNLAIGDLWAQPVV